MARLICFLIGHKYRTDWGFFIICKRCNNRTYTLDKLMPTTGCAQCGFAQFEHCGMKDALCDPLLERSTQLDLDSEMLSTLK